MQIVMKYPENENAPTGGRSTSQKFQHRPIKSHPSSENNYEDRRNTAACFKNPKKIELWQADYIGVMVLEGLRTGDKCWVNIRERVSRKTGKPYLSVELRRQEVER